MTQLKTIKAMLADADSCADELNARIWCWLKRIEWDDRHTSANFPQYTTSLDAAMSIGAKELKGIRMDISVEKSATASIYLRKPFHNWIRAEKLKNLPRAITLARIKALECKKG